MVNVLNCKFKNNGSNPFITYLVNVIGFFSST
jgi:hypothetical protein